MAPRLCRLMCGRPLAFREVSVILLGYALEFLRKGAEPAEKNEGFTVRQSLTTRRVAEPRVIA
jgi:hypothetical protein